MKMAQSTVEGNNRDVWKEVKHIKGCNSTLPMVAHLGHIRTKY